MRGAGTPGPAPVEKGLNFTLTCKLGAIDLLGEITGGGDYEKLLPDTVRVQLFGAECLCLKLETPIKVKRAAGRTKDVLAVDRSWPPLRGSAIEDQNGSISSSTGSENREP